MENKNSPAKYDLDEFTSPKGFTYGRMALDAAQTAELRENETRIVRPEFDEKTETEPGKVRENFPRKSRFFRETKKRGSRKPRFLFDKNYRMNP